MAKDNTVVGRERKKETDDDNKKNKKATVFAIEKKEGVATWRMRVTGGRFGGEAGNV